MLRYLRLPYDTCPLPPRDRNPFSKVCKAALKRKLFSKGKEHPPNFLQSESGSSKLPGFVHRSFSFVTRSPRNGQGLSCEEAIDELQEDVNALMQEGILRVDNIYRSLQEVRNSSAEEGKLGSEGLVEYFQEAEVKLVQERSSFAENAIDVISTHLALCQVNRRTDPSSSQIPAPTSKLRSSPSLKSISKLYAKRQIGA